eukprot:2891877-Lingulodinium_polyedra.AAC.1
MPPPAPGPALCCCRPRGQQEGHWHVAGAAAGPAHGRASQSRDWRRPAPRRSCVCSPAAMRKLGAHHSN